MSVQKEQLVALLRDKDFRDHFTADQVYELLAIQVRQLREKRQWTQAELGTRAGMQQVQVSRVENPDYKGARLTTLSKLAHAFDVALIVRFAPFSELADWLAHLSPASFEPVSFGEELSTLEYGASQTRAVAPFVSATVVDANITDLENYKQEMIIAGEGQAPSVPAERRLQYATA